MDSYIDRFERMIRDKLPTHDSVDEAVESTRNDFQFFTGSTTSPEHEAALQTAKDRVTKSLAEVEYLRRAHTMTSQHEDWYRGPLPKDRHWPALKGYLLNTKGWEPDSIESIDTCSSEVVSCLANPARDKFNYRGLVVGYVQSGKTANMTAVIAKAVDAGYNFIILLGGVTNKLRAQTQRRIEGDVVNRHRDLWELYTKADEDDGDFSEPANQRFTLPAKGRAQLAVIKKETTRLTAFLHTLERTPATIRRVLKALVIDDECDQASVNTAADHSDPSQINSKIRQILGGLPAASYIGYTATPFANVFINPFTDDKNTPDDLYPRDFITALPRPLEYFGTKEVFGYAPDDAGEPDDGSMGLDIIRTINTHELPQLRSTDRKGRKFFTPKVTQSLEHALLWFLLACAIRRKRGHSDQHMTMLIHASQYIEQHEKMAEAVRAWIADNRGQLIAGNGSAWKKLEQTWADETARMPLEHALEQTSAPATLHPWIQEVLHDLGVIVENSQSEERLKYTGKAKTSIVIGGSVLARGLTLEGIVVSFFLRTSLQYDTLLQMGRWFGFRKGYADLPRLWTTSRLTSNFRALAQIEDEIRQDMANYQDRHTTPLDFAVRVRSIPGLAITSAAKMRHAYRTSISFSGKHIQTIWFDHLDRETVARNWAAGTRLIDSIKDQLDPTKRYFRSVPAPQIRKFLGTYSICERHLDLRKNMLLEYLDKIGKGLGEWHVAVVCPPKGNPCRKDLGFMGKVRANNRSRLTEPSTQAYIKALMSKRDILVDMKDEAIDSKQSWDELKSRRPPCPLLLLYPIDAESIPKRKGAKRTMLGAVDDLLGIGIVFPGTKDRAGNIFSVELDILTPEQLGDDDEGEPDDE